MDSFRLWYKAIVLGWIIFVGLSFVIAGVGYGWRLALYSYFIHLDYSSVGEVFLGIVGKLIIYAPLITLPWAFNRDE